MQSKATAIYIILLICTIGLLSNSFAQAKPSIDLGFEKDNGYGVGDDIGGLWTITAHVSSDVQSVEFYLDGQLQQNDTQTPFAWQFDTSNYSAGSHAIKAVAYDSSGDSAFLQVERNFQETPTSTITIVIVAIAAAIVIVSVVVVLFRRKSNHR